MTAFEAAACSSFARLVSSLGSDPGGREGRRLGRYRDRDPVRDVVRRRCDVSVAAGDVVQASSLWIVSSAARFLGGKMAGLLEQVCMQTHLRSSISPTFLKLT